LAARHYEFDSYIGSGTWLTNHQRGEYVGDEGQTCKWIYFVKIVAAPADAYVADGSIIGPVIWGSFAIIEDVTNDACTELHGLQYLSEDHAGFGGW